MYSYPLPIVIHGCVPYSTTNQPVHPFHDHDRTIGHVQGPPMDYMFCVVYNHVIVLHFKSKYLRHEKAKGLSIFSKLVLAAMTGGCD